MVRPLQQPAAASRPAEKPSDLEAGVLHWSGDITGSHAAAHSEQRDTELGPFIRPVAHPIAAPETQTIAAERNPKLSQIPQLIGQLPCWRQTTRYRESDLARAQRELRRIARP